MSKGNDVKAPRFLGIGAARAGTTWLQTNLKQHPQIWLPPVKELHYFDCQRRGAAAYNMLPDRSVWRVSWMWYWRNSRALFHRMLRGRNLRFGMRYIFGCRTDRWYAKLFPRDRVSGEITPAYMLLPRHVVEEIRQLNPDLKVILMLRNPVSRAWSNARWKLGKDIMKASDETIRQLVDSRGFVMRNDYVSAIKTWRGVFGEKQVFIGFFDDLVSAPRDLLRAVLQFLEVDSDDSCIPSEVTRVVYGSKERDLPESLVPHMYGTYIEQLRELEKMIGGPVSKWLAKAEEAVAMKV